MIYALGVLVFVVGLLGSVMLHEAGHFLTARRYGMKATEFFVGFGPTLWSRKRGETEYGIKAIPAGGFVKIVGMTPLEELEPGDEDRAFYKHSPGRKTVVLAAGSTVHFVLTVLLVLAGTVLIGVPQQDAPVVSEPVATLPASTVEGAPTVASPAVGVLERGDRVLSVGGEPVQTWEDVVLAVRQAPGEQLPLVVERDGERVDVELTPVAVQRPSLLVRGMELEVGAIGVAQLVPVERVGPVETVEETVATLELMATGTWETITTRLDSIVDVYGPERDPQGVVGVVGIGRVSGEILGAQELSIEVRLLTLVLALAGLNFFVGIFNLLPLLPLDGGHIAVVAYEAARDRLKRLRGYTGPVVRVDYQKLLPLTYAVTLLFIGVTLFIVGADIVNPIRLTG